MSDSIKVIAVTLSIAALLMMAGQASASQRVVVFENFTATWCGHCPPVRQALTNLASDYGETDIAVVQIHGSDDYTVSWGNFRMNHFGVSAFPTVWMDGITEYVGETSESTFRNAFLSRRGVASPVLVEAGAVQVSGNTYDVSVRVTADPGVSTQTFKIYTLVLLDHYPSGSYYRNCLMQGVTSSVKSLSAGSSVIEKSRFTFGSSWSTSNIKILAIAESTSSSSPILNAKMIGWPLPPLDMKGDYDQNGMIDINDYAFFPDCLLGPDITASRDCTDPFDFDEDLDVDMIDFAAFQEAFTGTCPTIIEDPETILNCLGEMATFTVTAEGTEPLSYQWKYEGDVIPNATDSTLDVIIGEDTAGFYSCVVSNMCGSIESDDAELKVATQPIISTQPQSMDKCMGEIATFAARFTGMRPMTYQWQKDGVDIDGATGRDFTIDAVDLADAGTYVCIATNPCGSTFSDDAELTVSESPTIISQPESICVEPGETASFTVVLDGNPPYWCVWYKNGSTVVANGQGITTLTLNNVTTSNAGTYSVTVVSLSAINCEVYSEEATLQVGGCE